MQVDLQGPAGRLEALAEGPSEAAFAAVVCHPHPGMGGTMHSHAAYRLAKALHRGHDALVKRLAQGRETTPQNTLAAAPSPEQIHPGVMRYLREIGVAR